jgi:hypothetical protein
MQQKEEVRPTKSSVDFVRSELYPTSDRPLVDEVSANFCRQRVSHVQRNGSPWPYSRISGTLWAKQANESYHCAQAQIEEDLRSILRNNPMNQATTVNGRVNNADS